MLRGCENFGEKFPIVLKFELKISVKIVKWIGSRFEINKKRVKKLAFVISSVFLPNRSVKAISVTQSYEAKFGATKREGTNQHVT